jgi:hypothetical protein
MLLYCSWRWGETASQNCSHHPPGGIRVWRATVERYWQEKTEKLEEEPVPPQIPRGLAWARTLASAVRGRRLTAWAMARPWYTYSGYGPNFILIFTATIPSPERHGRVLKTTASYSGGPGFDSRPRRPAILIEVSRGSPLSLQANVLKLGHDRFLPNPFQFINSHLACHRRYIV